MVPQLATNPGRITPVRSGRPSLIRATRHESANTCFCLAGSRFRRRVHSARRRYRDAFDLLCFHILGSWLIAVGRWLLTIGPKGTPRYCGSAKIEASWACGSVCAIRAKGIQPTASVQSSSTGLPNIAALHIVETTGGQQNKERQSMAPDQVHERNIADKKNGSVTAKGSWEGRDVNSQDTPRLLVQYQWLEPHPTRILDMFCGYNNRVASSQYHCRFGASLAVLCSTQILILDAIAYPMRRSAVYITSRTVIPRHHGS